MSPNPAPRTQDRTAGDVRRPLRVVVTGGAAAARESRRACLALAGHQVIVAPTGAQAAEQCRLSRPDLIVADARLADLETLASDGACPDAPVPIVLVGAAADVARLDGLPH